MPPPKNFAYPYYLEYFEIPGQLSLYDMARLFPKDPPDQTQFQAWLRQASESVLDWHGAKRLPQSNSLALLALLTIRLQESGLSEQASAMLNAMTTHAGPSPDNQLIVADVHRFMGNDTAANAIELKLLEQGQLNVERIPDLVVHTITSEGPAQGLALGERASKLTLHPRMLSALIDAADKVRDEQASVTASVAAKV